MKTAISLPDTLYEKAEQAASYMGIPRSQLFAMALEEFISNHNGKMITEKINEIYGKIDQAEFEPYSDTVL
jgi:metal-responsive CopG/Arc/MetJ family transcriptional regulator